MGQGDNFEAGYDVDDANRTQQYYIPLYTPRQWLKLIIPTKYYDSQQCYNNYLLHLILLFPLVMITIILFILSNIKDRTPDLIIDSPFFPFALLLRLLAIIQSTVQRDIFFRIRIPRHRPTAQTTPYGKPNNNRNEKEN